VSSNSKILSVRMWGPGKGGGQSQGCVKGKGQQDGTTPKENYLVEPSASQRGRGEGEVMRRFADSS